MSMKLRIQSLGAGDTPDTLENKVNDVQRSNAKCKKKIDRLFRLLAETFPKQYPENQLRKLKSPEGIPGKQKRGLGNPILKLNVSHPPDSNEQVAFFAYLSTNTEANLRKHHTLIFDSVKVNNGQGYHGDDGIFTVPSSGVYLFAWTLTVQSTGGWASTEIVVNGVVSGSTFADGGDGNIDQAPGIVVVEANSGDHVYIRMEENGYDSIYSNARGRTSFMGWKLF